MRGVHASRSLTRSSIESRLFIIAIQIGYNRKRQKASKKTKTLAGCLAALRPSARAARANCHSFSRKLPRAHRSQSIRNFRRAALVDALAHTHTPPNVLRAAVQNEERSRSEKEGIENIDGVRFHYASVKSLCLLHAEKLLAATPRICIVLV
jgi:hypothetical protein